MSDIAMAAIPGVTAILSLGWWSVMRRQKLATVLGLSPWLVWWSIAVVPYALITLDKLIDHEYYLLPFALPLIVCVAHAVAYTVCRARLWWCGAQLSNMQLGGGLPLVVGSPVTVVSVRKTVA